MPQSSLISAERIATAIQSFGPEYRQLVFERYKHGHSLQKAVATPSPNFHDVTNFFGEEAAKFWLRFHIAETFAFLGIYDTASKFQVQQTADLILSHEIYGQLTLTEFLSFLQRFKRGDYGKIYNSARPNPQEFLQCLKPFWTDLSLERGRHEDRQRAERLYKEQQSAQPLTPEQEQKIEEIKKRLSEKFKTNIPS